jgi:hypothetical protein
MLAVQTQVSVTNPAGAETEKLALHQLFRSSAGGMRDKGSIKATLESCQTEQDPSKFEATKANCVSNYVDATRQLAYAFLRLAELDTAVLERLSRYEARLWRQAVQIIWVLDPIRAR